MKGIVEFRHDAPDEGAVAVPVLDEDHEWFVGQPEGLLGCEILCVGRMCSHTYAPPVQNGCPRATLSRPDEEFAGATTQRTASANPRCGLEGAEIRSGGRVPDVPAVYDPVQGAVQPFVGVRIVRRAHVDHDAHALYAFPLAAPRMARISS